VNKSLAAAVLAAASLLVVPACATVNPDAASVGDTHIRISDFEKRVADVVQVPTLKAQYGDSGTAPNDMARTLLTFEIRTVLAKELLADQGAPLTADEIKAAEGDAKIIFAEDPAAADLAWNTLKPDTRQFFATYYASQQKLSSRIKDTGFSDNALQAHYDELAAGGGAPPFEEVKDQVAESLVNKTLQDSLAGRATDVRVDPRYGEFFPATASFTPPQPTP
jgi:hypothetical protein